jgi:hypothetical protein
MKEFLIIFSAVTEEYFCIIFCGWKNCKWDTKEEKKTKYIFKVIIYLFYLILLLHLYPYSFGHI